MAGVNLIIMGFIFLAGVWGGFLVGRSIGVYQGYQRGFQDGMKIQPNSFPLAGGVILFIVIALIVLNWLL